MTEFACTGGARKATTTSATKTVCVKAYPVVPTPVAPVAVLLEYQTVTAPTIRFQFARGTAGWGEAG